MKNYEEITHDLLERRDRYVAEQKRKRKRVIGVVASLGCFCLAALMGVGVWLGGMPTALKNIPDNNSTIPDNLGKSDDTSPENHGGAQSEPPANSQEDNSSNPTVTAPPASQTTPNNPSNSDSDPDSDTSGGGNPGGNNPAAEFAYKTVGYKEAKKLFGYPIVECKDANFTNYSIGVVSQNGNICDYSSLIYSFTNGVSVTLFNQKIAVLYFGEFGEGEDSVKTVEYNGRTFLINENASADEKQYYHRIGYFPNQDKGICYIADVTDETIKQTEVLDLIISLEIK